MNNLIPILVAFPLAAGFILALLPGKWLKSADSIALVASSIVFLMAAALYGYEGIYEIGGWSSPVGINLHIDSFGWLMLIAVSFVGLSVMLFSINYMKTYTSRNRYYVLFFMMTAGINGTLLAGDIFNRFVYVELAAIASYVLVGFGCGAKELTAALKYAVLGAAASAVSLFGIAFLYALYGTVDMALLGEVISGLETVYPFSPLHLAAGLAITGFVFKAAAFPLHIWQPDALSAAPAPVSAIVSGALISSTGIYALLRTVNTVFSGALRLGPAVAAIGLFSVAAGTLTASGTKEYKRKISYYSISQVGYILLGFGFAWHLIYSESSAAAVFLAGSGAIFHLLNYAVFTPLIFLKSGAAEYPEKRDRDFPGVSYAGILSLAGVPPFAGFISKAMIIAACFISGTYSGFAAGVIASAAAVYTLISLTRSNIINFRIKRKKARNISGRIPLLMKIPIWSLSALCILLWLLFIPVLRERIIEPARLSIMPQVRAGVEGSLR